MKKLSYMVLGLFLTVSIMAKKADSQDLTVNKLPSTAEEFVQLRDQLATTPEGGALMLIVATQLYVQDKKLGLACITIALDSSQIRKGNAYKGYEPGGSYSFLLGQINTRPYLPWGYVKGATADNGYKVDAPYTYTFTRNKYSGDESSGTVKVFVETYNVMPRPITVKRNNKGLWKVYEASSIFVAVKAPVQTVDDDL